MYIHVNYFLSSIQKPTAPNSEFQTSYCCKLSGATLRRILLRASIKSFAIIFLTWNEIFVMIFYRILKYQQFYYIYSTILQSRWPQKSVKNSVPVLWALCSQTDVSQSHFMINITIYAFRFNIHRVPPYHQNSDSVSINSTIGLDAYCYHASSLTACNSSKEEDFLRLQFMFPFINQWCKGVADKGE